MDVEGLLLKNWESEAWWKVHIFCFFYLNKAAKLKPSHWAPPISQYLQLICATTLGATCTTEKALYVVPMQLKKAFCCLWYYVNHVIISLVSTDWSNALSMSVIPHLHAWMISTDDTFINGRWNCHLSDFAHVFQRFGAILAKFCNLCEQNVTNDNFIHGWTNLIHGWKTSCIEDIYRWHPRMKMTDDGHGHGRNFTSVSWNQR